MNAKCLCNLCNQPLEFPSEMAGETVECPHCKMDTKLFIPVSPITPKPKSPEKPKVDPENATDEKSKAIERNLRSIGRLFFWLGLIGLGIGGVIYVGEMHAGGDGETGALGVGFGIIAFFQGCIFLVLFQALAEIIRLLRKLVLKP